MTDNQKEKDNEETKEEDVDVVEEGDKDDSTKGPCCDVAISFLR